MLVSFRELKATRKLALGVEMPPVEGRELFDVCEEVFDDYGIRSAMSVFFVRALWARIGSVAPRYGSRTLALSVEKPLAC